MTIVVETETVQTHETTDVVPSRSPRITGGARWRAAVLLTTGAALQVAEFFLEPAKADTAARLDWWVAHPMRLELSQAAGLLAIPFLIGAFLTMLRLARPHSRRICGVAGVALTGAMVGLAAIHGVELAASWVLKSGDRAAASTILEVAQPGIPGVVLMVMFLVGALIGTVLLNIALWRSPFVPRIAVLLGISFTVLDIVAGFGRLGHLAGLASGCVLAWAVVTGYVRTPRSSARVGAH